jgi:hypothetical protein
LVEAVRDSGRYEVKVIDPQEWLPENPGTGDVRLHEYSNRKPHGILCAPPCTIFSGSGARWWEAKGLDPLLEGLAIADACVRIVTMHKPTWWALENPVGRLRRWYGPPTYTFHPNQSRRPLHQEDLAVGGVHHS